MRAERIDHDVLIVGAGLAGAAFACAVDEPSVGLLAPAPAPGKSPEAGPGTFDARVYAITPGNAERLGALGVWNAIDASALTPVHAMRVFGDDGRAQIEFDAWRAGVPALAWIVEDRRLQAALDDAVAARREVTRIDPSTCVQLDVDDRAATLWLEDGRRLRSRLLVGADGAHSRVRLLAGLGAHAQRYDQTAVVANFACERPHRNVAFQWFQGGDRGGAVLALLPLPGAHVSMVWSLPDAEAERVIALAPDALCGAVEAACAGRLGALGLVTPARAFALRRQRAVRAVAPRVALIGDAAHVVHPLAGQGANLGLQDAHGLAAALAGRGPMHDPGALPVLRRHARARAEPVASMGLVIHGLQRLFGAQDRGVARLRNAGLELADRLPVLKNILVRQAMH